MAEISNGVGEGGVNAAGDVALVQLMLRLAKNAKQQVYLNAPYTGTYDVPTKNAIVAFQTDAKLVPAPDPAKNATPPDPNAEKAGFVGKDSETFKRLVATLPATHKDIHVLAGAAITIYVKAPAADAQASEAAIVGDPQLETTFRASVRSLVQQMHSQHHIALWLTPTGSRRNFAEQAAETATKAGPGESNHNFGRAVDIGFKGFPWVQGDGTIKKDAPWLNALELVSKPKANALWNARDAVATSLGLHRLQFERVHLQAFDQSTVSSGRSLVALLNTVTVGKMVWDASYDTAGKKWQYKCDLGATGGPLHPVGSSKQIWAGQATVTKAIVAATWTKQAKDKKAWKDADVKQTDLDDVRTRLKAEFEAADAGWLQWKAVP